MLDLLHAFILNLVNNPTATMLSFVFGFIVGWSAKAFFGKHTYHPAECTTENNHRINYTSIRQFSKEKDIICPKLRKDLTCADTDKPCYRKHQRKEIQPTITPKTKTRANAHSIFAPLYKFMVCPQRNPFVIITWQNKLNKGLRYEHYYQHSL